MVVVILKTHAKLSILVNQKYHWVTTENNSDNRDLFMYWHFLTNSSPYILVKEQTLD